MTKRNAMFLIILGMFMTAGGVGGIEQSVNDTDLWTSVIVSVTGLAIMWAGTLGVRNSKYFG